MNNLIIFMSTPHVLLPERSEPFPAAAGFLLSARSTANLPLRWCQCSHSRFHDPIPCGERTALPCATSLVKIAEAGLGRVIMDCDHLIGFSSRMKYRLGAKVSCTVNDGALGLDFHDGRPHIAPPAGTPSMIHDPPCARPPCAGGFDRHRHFVAASRLIDHRADYSVPDCRGLPIRQILINLPENRKSSSRPPERSTSTDISHRDA